MNSLPLNPEKIYDDTECILVLPDVITRAELANCRSWHDEKDATMFGRGSVKITDVTHMTKHRSTVVLNTYRWSRGVFPLDAESIVTVVYYIASVNGPTREQKPEPPIVSINWLNGNVVEVYGPNAAIIGDAVAVFLRNSPPLAEGRGGSPFEVVVR